MQKLKKYMDLNELILEKRAKTALLRSIIETGEAEKRELNTDENIRFSTIQDEIRALDKEINAKHNKQTIIINKEKRMDKNFSLLKAIEARANGRSIEDSAVTVIEQGKDEMRKAGLSFSGDIVLPMEYRANIVAGVATSGQEFVAEEKAGLIEPLREALVTVKAGATFLTGLSGDVSIPRYTGSNALWKGEVAAATDGAGTTSEITLSPKRITAFIDVSKQFLNQNSPAVEAMLMRDIVNAVSAKLENTIFGSAAGSATQPAGFFADAPSINGAASFANMVALETAVDTANALGTAKYITNAGGRGILKTVPKVAGQPIYILGDSGEMNGYPVLVTNHVAKNLQVGADEFGVVFGDWSQYVIAQWGAIDLTVDAISQAINGNVRIVINAYFDAKPKVAEAFKTASIK